MAIEAKRGCGYRKVGGLYLVASPAGFSCCRLPLPLKVCPCCNQGIKQARGWTWIDPVQMFGPLLECKAPFPCPAADPSRMGATIGLLWIGEQFYPTPEHFMREANMQGISRRLAAVPKGFKAGETWVAFAHPKGMLDDAAGEMVPAVISFVRPRGLERIVTQTDYDTKDDEREADAKRGVVWVPVPDDDPDHMGSAYDKPAGPELFQEG